MKYYLKIGNFKIDPQRKKSLIPSGTVGAINELLVCSDLLSKGYHVFRSVSQSCPCDLIILDKGSALRVEVKTGRMNKDGSVSSPNKADKSNYDVLATVVGARIFYDPVIGSINQGKEKNNDGSNLSNDQRSSRPSQNFKNHSLPHGRTPGTAREETRKTMEVLKIGNRGMVQMELEGVKKFIH